MRQSVRIAMLAMAPVLAVAAAQGWLSPDHSEPAGTHYKTFPSHLAGGDASYLIYLPPDYETAPARRYPVVYWLHGLNGDQKGGAPFVKQLDRAIRNGTAPAMIAVLVNGTKDSFYCDSPDGKWPVESMIVTELIPHIDETYRTLARRETRAVEGYSMGGYGAAHLGFKYPDLFGVVGVMAGALIKTETFTGGQQAIFHKMFGGDIARVEENDPFTMVRKNADAIRGRTAVRVAVGDLDALQLRDQAFHELLRELKIEHQYEVVPGVAHNGALFYATLGERAFAYYVKAFAPKGPQAPLPARTPNATGQSRVLKRGDLEILTYETEQEYDRLQELYKNQPTAAEPGKLTTRYLRSRTDGSVQPYAVRLPNGYSAGRAYPVVVQLHGLNFHEVLAGARGRYRGMERQWIEPDLPVIYAQCFGRPSTFYQGMGEEDVLEVVDEVKRLFAVDGDRVFVMGHSMGGAGSFLVGLHYPDRFGGILPMDPAMWDKQRPVEDAPEWMKPQIAIVTPGKLYPNARNLDVYFKNAGEGIQRRSTEFSDGIVAAGGFSTSESFPGMPHNFGDVYAYSNFVTELIQHPVRRRANEVKFYTNTLRYNQAYWVTVDRLTRTAADASVTAKLEGGEIRVTTGNIDALTLRLGEGPIGKDTPRAVVVDGHEAFSGPPPGVLHLAKTGGAWKAGEWPGGGRSKRHGSQGPIGDAFNSRFLAVYGERDRDLAIAELDAIRNPPGPLDIHGDFPMKAAAKVTHEDIESSNLILFGTPESNAVLKRIAPSLPADLMQPGAVFIYPNPENPARYVVVWSAKILSAPESNVRSGWIMPLNLLPDYIRVSDGKVASGGHFDSDWNLPVK